MRVFGRCAGMKGALNPRARFPRVAPRDKTRLATEFFAKLPGQRAPDRINSFFVERKCSRFSAHSVRSKKFFHNFLKYQNDKLTLRSRFYNCKKRFINRPTAL